MHQPNLWQLSLQTYYVTSRWPLRHSPFEARECGLYRTNHVPRDTSFHTSKIHNIAHKWWRKLFIGFVSEISLTHWMASYHVLRWIVLFQSANRIWATFAVCGSVRTNWLRDRTEGKDPSNSLGGLRLIFMYIFGTFNVKNRFILDLRAIMASINILFQITVQQLRLEQWGHCTSDEYRPDETFLLTKTEIRNKTGLRG